MNDYIKIVSGSAVTINRIAQLLEEKGIPSLVKNNAESARLAGFGALSTDVELHVFEADVARAKQIASQVTTGG